MHVARRRRPARLHSCRDNETRWYFRPARFAIWRRRRTRGSCRHCRRATSHHGCSPAKRVVRPDTRPQHWALAAARTHRTLQSTHRPATAAARSRHQLRRAASLAVVDRTCGATGAFMRGKLAARPHGPTPGSHAILEHAERAPPVRRAWSCPQRRAKAQTRRRELTGLGKHHPGNRQHGSRWGRGRPHTAARGTASTRARVAAAACGRATGARVAGGRGGGRRAEGVLRGAHRQQHAAGSTSLG
jgi:hypothetical protein